jgi:hypothetical protein
MPPSLNSLLGPPAPALGWVQRSSVYFLSLYFHSTAHVGRHAVPTKLQATWGQDWTSLCAVTVPHWHGSAMHSTNTCRVHRMCQDYTGCWEQKLAYKTYLWTWKDKCESNKHSNKYWTFFIVPCSILGVGDKMGNPCPCAVYIANCTVISIQWKDMGTTTGSMTRTWPVWMVLREGYPEEVTILSY